MNQPCPLTRMSSAGVLEDLVHPAEEDARVALRRTEVWKSRGLLLHCRQCLLVCDAYRSFEIHCKLHSHKQKLTRFGPINDPTMVDPRHSEDFRSLPQMSQYKLV
jgi:hypothetical protein